MNSGVSVFLALITGKFLFVDQAGGAFRSCVKQVDLRELARPRLTQLMDTTGLYVTWGLLITAALITF